MTPHIKSSIVVSVRQRLINISKQRHEDPNLVFIRYAIERFLYRLSCAGQAAKFILKGAMLFAIWSDKPYRSTKDLDLLGYGDASPDQLHHIFRKICTTKVEPDGLEFNPDTIQISEIREELDYPGQRIRLEGRLGNARIHLLIDIGFGDCVTPAPSLIDYPTLLEMPSPRIRAYPIETVVAEKFEALISRDMANSRMKDFYDLKIMAQEFEFHGILLTTAIAATFARRGTPLPTEKPIALTEEFHQHPNKQSQWKAFIKARNLDNTILDLSRITEEIQHFLLPLVSALTENKPFDKNWLPGGPWK